MPYDRERIAASVLTLGLIAALGGSLLQGLGYLNEGTRFGLAIAGLTIVVVGIGYLIITISIGH